MVASPHSPELPAIQRRLTELCARFENTRCNLGWLLCDQHDPADVAFRLTAGDGLFKAVTYGELREKSGRFAAGLRSLGVRPGDRVATLMGKSEELLIALVGIWKAGAVYVPLFTAFAPVAIAYRLSASRAKIVICDAVQESKLAPGEGMPAKAPWRIVSGGSAHNAVMSFQSLLDARAPALEPIEYGSADPIIEIYTSGTTGHPKCVVMPMRSLANSLLYAEFGLDLRSDDVVWIAADPGWAYGLHFGLMVPLCLGLANIWLQAGFSPETTWKTLVAAGVTNFFAGATIYRALLRSSAPPRCELRLRCASTAGEPLTPDINAWAPNALGVEVHDHYGQTEAGMLVNNHHHPDLREPLKVGSMGRAMPGWCLSVLKIDSDDPAGPGSVGRLAADLTCSPLAWFQGYAGDPEKSNQRFSADRRWYLTGDLVRMDEEGRHFFVAREDEAILMAGYRIGPAEVEAIILEHPAVADCAVFAVSDEIRGEVLTAAVVPCPGIVGSVALQEEIQRWVRERYAAHAYPRAVHFVAALPRTPSGKIQRFVLRQTYSTGPQEMRA